MERMWIIFAPGAALNLILFFGPLPRVDGWFFIGILGSAILNTLAHLAATQALREGEPRLSRRTSSSG